MPDSKQAVLLNLFASVYVEVGTSLPILRNLIGPPVADGLRLDPTQQAVTLQSGKGSPM